MTVTVEYWLDKHPEDLKSRFSKSFILDGIKLILENNNFCFNNIHYKQIKGAAMGTKFAPVYATLTTAYLEENCIQKSRTSSVPILETILRRIGNGFLMIVLYRGQNPFKN